MWVVSYLWKPNNLLIPSSSILKYDQVWTSSFILKYDPYVSPKPPLPFCSITLCETVSPLTTLSFYSMTLYETISTPNPVFLSTVWPYMISSVPLPSSSILEYDPYMRSSVPLPSSSILQYDPYLQTVNHTDGTITVTGMYGEVWRLLQEYMGFTWVKEHLEISYFKTTDSKLIYGKIMQILSATHSNIKNWSEAAVLYEKYI